MMNKNGTCLWCTGSLVSISFHASDTREIKTDMQQPRSCGDWCSMGISNGPQIGVLYLM